jgi:hypothetical protein
MQQVKSILWCLSAIALTAGGAEPEMFHRLVSLPAPKIIAAAEAFSGGGWDADNLLKPAVSGGYRQEYASRGKGVQTFVDFDFGQPVRLAAFRHMQRKHPDTIAEALLLFSDAPDFNTVKATVKVKHVDESEAVTFAAFAPVAARYVRWQVTALIKGTSPNVGGKGVEFFVAGAAEACPAGVTIQSRTVQVIDRKGDTLVQPFNVTLDSPYAEPIQAVLHVEGLDPKPVELTFGKQAVAYTIASSDAARPLEISLVVGTNKVVTRSETVRPAAKRTVYVLPHSHTDIGYTAIQTDIEEKQINNLLQGMAEARRTADYPKGSRFIWNVEVLWAADLFMQRLPEQHCAELLKAIKSGQVSLNGMYLNELTGLCRPEELVRLFRYATQLGERTGRPVDSAMISDVPGYTWGTVTAMAQAGIRYFSVAPNYFDRIGNILVQWENKPFWWIGPDGQSKVLVWIPFWGYAMSHRYGKMSRQLVEDFCDGLEKQDYPYDLAYVRWAGHGDNAVPDPSICDFVRDWNAAHVWPQFVIASTSEAFSAFEKKYGDKLPQVRGDWSPYWEDGAGSSAAETAMNRASSERLRQAETLWALLEPRRYPAKRFEDAWNHVLLYSEHTWGAYCSISQPGSPFATDQWNIKQSYAAAANLQSRQLLNDAAQVKSEIGGQRTEDRGPRTAVGGQRTAAGEKGKDTFVDVYNTASWMRTEVVRLPRELSEAGSAVADMQGNPVPSQRLTSGELAMLVREMPPFSGRRYLLKKEGKTADVESVKVVGAVIDNGRLRVRLDEQTGGIIELHASGISTNLVDTASGHALNDYLYLLGDDVSKLQRNGPVKITVLDKGPLVASLLVESDAPGCHLLSREIRLTAGGESVELFNRVDKKRLVAKSYYAQDGKESVNFAFPFNVPGGEIRMDVPFGVFRPELDQMPSACKNWLTVGTWADVANQAFGVTWVTLDAPLVQVGGITATLLNSQFNPDVWRKKIEPTQKLYSWAMNNHWGTNYRAYQEEPVVFRFVLRPHLGATEAAAATRFAADTCQPLLAVPGRGPAPDTRPLLSVEPSNVLVSALKPSDDSRALIVRLFNAGTNPADAELTWGRKAPRRLWLSDTGERPGRKLSSRGAVTLPASGLIALRAEFSE